MTKAPRGFLGAFAKAVTHEESSLMDNIPDWITHRYAHHAPKTQDRIEQHQALREEFALMANVLETLLPPGREKAMAHTSLQQASWAAHAALALNEEEPPETPSP